MTGHERAKDGAMGYERTTLVGREAELDQLRALLRDHQLVTVVGIGGVGKSRLTLAVADTWSSPTAVCELDRQSGADLLADAVAGSLGYPTLDAAAVGLCSTRRLPILDGCEHLIDRSAAVVERLTAECPELSVLATSREPLDVPGERVMALGALALPAGDEPAEVLASPAVRLFLDRATAAGTVDLDPVASPEIVQLCRMLDGLPLAIELAAARTLSLTPAEIRGHLDDRLDLLARRRGRGPARHRSLEAAIGWSYDRLPDETKVFFDRLGVFGGRFSAEQAHAVAAEAGEDLLRVVDPA